MTILAHINNNKQIFNKMKKEILTPEQASKTKKQKEMETKVKRPMGRPKGKIRRFQKIYFVSDHEEILMTEYYKTIKQKEPIKPQ